MRLRDIILIGIIESLECLALGFFNFNTTNTRTPKNPILDEVDDG